MGTWPSGNLRQPDPRLWRHGSTIRGTSKWEFSFLILLFFLYFFWFFNTFSDFFLFFWFFSDFSQLIDGEAFLLMTQKDIVDTLKVKLGPAVKIYNSILLIRDGMEVWRKHLSSSLYNWEWILSHFCPIYVQSSLPCWWSHHPKKELYNMPYWWPYHPKKEVYNTPFWWSHHLMKEFP